jgi:hypothetical protein
MRAQHRMQRARRGTHRLGEAAPPLAHRVAARAGVALGGDGHVQDGRRPGRVKLRLHRGVAQRVEDGVLEGALVRHHRRGGAPPAAALPACRRAVPAAAAAAPRHLRPAGAQPRQPLGREAQPRELHERLHGQHEDGDLQGDDAAAAHEEAQAAAAGAARARAALGGGIQHAAGLHGGRGGVAAGAKSRRTAGRARRSRSPGGGCGRAQARSFSLGGRSEVARLSCGEVQRRGRRARRGTPAHAGWRVGQRAGSKRRRAVGAQGGCGAQRCSAGGGACRAEMSTARVPSSRAAAALQARVAAAWPRVCWAG